MSINLNNNTGNNTSNNIGNNNAAINTNNPPETTTNNVQQALNVVQTEIPPLPSRRRPRSDSFDTAEPPLNRPANFSNNLLSQNQLANTLTAATTFTTTQTASTSPLGNTENINSVSVELLQNFNSLSENLDTALMMVANEGDVAFQTIQQNIPLLQDALLAGNQENADILEQEILTAITNIVQDADTDALTEAAQLAAQSIDTADDLEADGVFENFSAGQQNTIQIHSFIFQQFHEAATYTPPPLHEAPNSLPQQ